MTTEKAREFFSAYYEGTLDPGLSVSFEQKLQNDDTLKREYSSFQTAMESLGTLQFEAIEVPVDLSERISARIDLQIYEQKRKAAPVWTAWLRNFAIAGVGAVAIAFAVVQMNARGSESASGIVPAPATDQLRFANSAQGVSVIYAPVSEKAVVISNSAGKELRRESAGTATTPKVEDILSNPHPTAFVFSVRVEGESQNNFVAVPGTQRSNINGGEGTMLDMAKAIADYYHTPVLLKLRDGQLSATWAFTSADVVGEVTHSLGSKFNVTLMQNGILSIEQN